MQIVFMDFESFWSQTHTLTKMNPIAYVMHPETEIISLAIKFGNYPTDVIFGEDEIRKMVAKIDWSDKMVVAHNMSEFDAMICAWRFGIKPKMWGCTLAMAAPIHQKDVGGSLKALVAHYGLGVKDATALNNTKGRHLKDFTPAEIEAMREYNKADTEQCAALFYKLLPQTPLTEMKLIDMTIRMWVEPRFDADMALIESTLAEERERKKLMLLDLASLLGIPTQTYDEDTVVTVVESTLASAAKFGKLLRDLGVEVPTKPSPSDPDKDIPALAKTDQEFLDLQEHDDPIVAAAATARLGVKSTILESRLQTMLDIANATKGKLPIPLKYYSAHTGRWGGRVWNPQNLPRIPRDKEGNIAPKPTNAIRMALKAPPGHKVIVADLSGIELRMNHFLWMVPSSMELFKADPEKADLYKDFASKMYNVPVGEVTKAQRQVGKVAHLGLGFGAGSKTFVRVAKTMGGIDMSEAESLSVVNTWRDAYQQITAGWKSCGKALHAMIDGSSSHPIDPWGLCRTEHEAIVTPRGRIRYPKLRREGDGFVCGEGRSFMHLHGGLITENIVQHLSRHVLTDAMLEYAKSPVGQKFPIVHTVHDELIVIAPDAVAEMVLQYLQNIMRKPPEWFPGLVLWSEGDVADSYGSAK